VSSSFVDLCPEHFASIDCIVVVVGLKSDLGDVKKEQYEELYHKAEVASI